MNAPYDQEYRPDWWHRDPGKTILWCVAVGFGIALALLFAAARWWAFVQVVRLAAQP